MIRVVLSFFMVQMRIQKQSEVCCIMGRLIDKIWDSHLEVKIIYYSIHKEVNGY